jgi:hypothetical protein
MKAPSMSKGSLKHRTQHAVKAVASSSMPVIRPLAWRARTFLSRPAQDAEVRTNQRLESVEANMRDRLDQILAVLSAHDAAAVRAAREPRKLHASLRQLIEEDAAEIEVLKTEVSRLRQLLETAAAADQGLVE